MSYLTIGTNLIAYQIGQWAGFFAKNHYHAFELDNNGVVFIDSKNQKHRIDFLEMSSDITTDVGWFRDTLIFSQMDGQSIRFGGVSKNQTKKLQTELNRSLRSYLKNFYQQFERTFHQATQEAKLLFSGQYYIRHKIADQWLKQYKHLTLGLSRKDKGDYIKFNVSSDIQQVYLILEQGYHQIERFNQAFIDRQLNAYQSFFDQVESNPLTDQQRKACVIDEHHNLVLAGAGTGKTSTMIGRAGYLIKAGLARPKQILLLAYARKAAEEMEERIQSKLAIDKLTVKTFHSLGKYIITQVEGCVPEINKMAEDTELRTRFVDEQIQLLLQDDRYKSRLVTYFLRFLYPYKSQYDFESLGAYNAYLLENDLRTLQGELVKSYEECEIANFLYRQGVAYQYEANYQVNTSGPDYKVYQPDFFLPDYGIYIEHFAVNEQNQTPVFINQKSYLEGMAWKRALHQKYQTSLIETFSYYKQQGRLTDVLNEKLLDSGVKFKPLPQNELLTQLHQQGRVSEFSQLMAQLLALFKSANHTIKNLIELANQHEDCERMQAAAYLFEPIYEAYQQHLRDSASIDFEDMIGRAIEYVESGRYQSPYRYLLVDEFQDISASRARLLKALMAQQPECSLFCVGDDWQSIYRFSGSDVSLTKDFEANFGATVTSVLDKTFRFNNQIGELASRFVTQNPSQIKKQINSHDCVEQNAVSVILTDQDLAGIQAALTAISARSTKPASILLLARFHFKKPDIATLKRQYPHFSIQFMSVHASKGKEADYVIIFGLEKGQHGFPSEKATHSLLELVLPKAEKYKYAEERRLFYVALTRARHHVYLITNGNNASPFVRELIENRYPIQLETFKGKGFQDKIASIPCSHCQAGYMVARDSRFGSFFGCSQYPLCNYTQHACQWCGSGLQTKSQFRVCENPRCDFKEPICPECGGTLNLRKGRNGQFWGCSNYRKDTEFSCTHTSSFIDLKTATLK
jgi:DNA helicase IV